MEFQVNTNNVILAQINQVESGEYNVTECRFIFSSEYEGLTKIAVFTGANGDAYKITILNNKCEIPSELLTESQIVQIGVYAYEVQGTEFILRYSPMPTRFMIEKGSYVVNAVNMSRPTPTEVEQLQSQITHNANNIEGIQGDIAGINQELVGINGELLGINRDIDDIKAEQTEQNTKIQKNTDDIVEINQNINEIDGHINAINEDIDNLEQDLTNYSLITETGSQIILNVNSTNYQITAILKDKNGNVIYTSNAIDLPIESMIVNARYDNATKEIVLTLQNGNTLRISVADLVSGLVSETQLQTILANYYTKTEVDNLLSEKANQTSLDTTNQNLTNLAGRVSTNETDIVNIKTEQTTQNTNIEELQNQVETLQEDLDNANSEIAELNTDITNMAKAMYKVDGQGSDITLPNTSENKFVEFGLEGRTEQDGEPTSETPIPIKNVTGNANVKIQNKNLLKTTTNYNTTLNGVTVTTNSDGTITLNGTATRNTEFKFMLDNEKIILKANKNYMIQRTLLEGVASNILIAYYLNTTVGTFSNENKNLGESNNERDLSVIRIFCNTNDTFNNAKIGITVYEGSTATSYVPHAEQNYPFTFAEGQRGMQGTTLEDNGIHNKHKQRVFDGTENFSVNPNYTTENILCVQITINDVKPTTNQCLCSHFKYYSASTIKNAFRFAGKFLLFTVDRNEYATLEDLKTKFANEYANGTPVIVEYELAESELENNIIPYNATQQAQYNNFKNAYTYKDITYITSTSDELGFNMNVVAVADANKVIDNQNNEIDTIKSRLDLLEG